MTGWSSFIAYILWVEVLFYVWNDCDFKPTTFVLLVSYPHISTYGQHSPSQQNTLQREMWWRRTSLVMWLETMTVGIMVDADENNMFVPFLSHGQMHANVLFRNGSFFKCLALIINECSSFGRIISVLHIWATYTHRSESGTYICSIITDSYCEICFTWTNWIKKKKLSMWKWQDRKSFVVINRY